MQVTWLQGGGLVDVLQKKDSLGKEEKRRRESKSWTISVSDEESKDADGIRGGGTQAAPLIAQ